jgi:hypothetical protein
MRKYAVLLLLASLPGCNSQPKQPPLQTALEQEKGATEQESDADRVAARQAADAYVREKMPNWKIKGTSLTYLSARFYAAVDVANSNNQSAVLNLEINRFISEDGSLYWKAQPSEAGTIRTDPSPQQSR